MMGKEKIKKEIKIPFDVKIWKDKNKIWLVYSKKYDISAYGKTKKRALRMFELHIKQILSYTMNPKIKTKKKK